MKPLIHDKFLLEKYPGKGGWTYARLPRIKLQNKKPSKSYRVKGSIDGFEIKQYHLMPMGEEHLFLPVRLEIRKKIHKEAGQWIEVILFQDDDPLAIPEELWLCLRDEPAALSFFKQLSDSEKKFYVQWIYSAKKPETKTNRMVKTLERLSLGKKLYEIAQ